jgi:hypothetical protein
VSLSGVLGVPLEAAAVIVNAAAVNAAGSGHVTIAPCGGAAPTTSNLNVRPGEASAVAAVAVPGPDRRVCVRSTTDVDLIIDLAAYVDPNSE